MITFQGMQDVVVFIDRLVNEGFIKSHPEANETRFKANALELGQQFLMNGAGETYFLPDLLALTEADAQSSTLSFRSEKSQTVAYTLYAVWLHFKRHQEIQTLSLIHNVPFAKALLEMTLANGKLHLHLPAYLVDPCLVLEGREYQSHNAFNLKTQLSLAKGTDLFVSPEPSIRLTKQAILCNQVLRQLITCDLPARLSDGRWVELAAYKHNLIQWERYWAQKEAKCVRKMGNSALVQKTTATLSVMLAGVNARLADCSDRQIQAEDRAKRIMKYLITGSLLLALVSLALTFCGFLALGVCDGKGLPFSLMAVGFIGTITCMPVGTRMIKSRVEAQILSHLRENLAQEEDELTAQVNDIQHILTRRNKRPNDTALLLAKKETIQAARIEIRQKIEAIPSRKPSLWQRAQPVGPRQKDEEKIPILTPK